MKMSDITGVSKEPRTFQPSPLLPTNDFMGIEIELENFEYEGVGEFSSDYWLVKEDPSLRGGGREFVFHQPLNGHDMVMALEEVDQFFQWYQNHFDDISVSERCSVHGHLDVRNMTPVELLYLALTTEVFERPMFRLFGKSRSDSNYTLPIYKSTDKYRLAHLTSESRADILNGLMSSKYSAFNTQPVRTQGSVEYRMMEGTTDAQHILLFVQTVLSMKKFAQSTDVNFLNFPEYVSHRGLETFVKDVMGDIADRFFYDGWQQDIWYGIRVAQDTVIRTKLMKAHVANINKYEKMNPSLKGFQKYAEENPQPVVDTQSEVIYNLDVDALFKAADIKNTDLDYYLEDPDLEFEALEVL